MYNVLDLISRYIPLIKCLKLESRKGLFIAILSRFLLIPAFYFTAKYGDQGWMIFLVSFLGLTNGYLTVCVLTVAPKGYTVNSLALFSYLHHVHKLYRMNFEYQLILFVICLWFCRVLNRMH